MIITEVKSLLDLVVEATKFALQLQDGWYKGSAEVDAFQDKVSLLREKHSQWSNQVRRHGISEDQHLQLSVQAAIQNLDKQQQYVMRLQKNYLLRLRKKVFPSELSYCLDKVLEIVDAGPKLLADRVDTHDLLERGIAQTPASLPFSPDPRYVPISGTILEVQEALEDAEGPRVVTIFGGPGQGKSSLVKYVGLHYEEENKQQINDRMPQKALSFSDGVYYLFCGQGAQDRVKHLLLELIECLGFGGSSIGSLNDSTAAGVAGVQGDPYSQVLLPRQMKLRSCLAQQKVLLIFDDLWEVEVLEQFLVPGKGVKYLITSQSREIWGNAKKIQLKDPTMAEARTIVANYTDGLPTKGTFPESIQNVTDIIIENLNCHPLSLANVGISVNRSRAANLSHWETICQNVHVYLEKNDFHGSPIIYDRPYSLTVGASMMLMVDSLLQEARPLLFLVALLGEPELPETLIKFFYKCIQSKDFNLKYDIYEKYLEDRSLVQLKMRGNESILVTHTLRMYYIREIESLHVRSIASQILGASSNQDSVQVIKSRDADETLVAVLSAMYYKEPFTDIAASSLEHHCRIINDGVIPRAFNVGRDRTDVVNWASEFRHESLLAFLIVDEGEADWKQQAHEYAKKIIIKLCCQGKLDDHSMASLLQISQATSEAVVVLSNLCHSRLFKPDFNDLTNIFSNLHEETIKTLLALLHDNSRSAEIRADIIKIIFHIIENDTENTIFSVAAKLTEFLANDAIPTLQIASTTGFCSEFPPSRGAIVMSQFPGILEALVALLVSGKVDGEVRISVGLFISSICRSNAIVLKIALIPDALQKLFDLFLSDQSVKAVPSFGRASLHGAFPCCNWPVDTVSSIAGAILGSLSSVPASRTKFPKVGGSLESLGDIVANVKGIWQATVKREEHENVEKRASVAAGILGELAFEKELKEIIALLPGIEEGLLFLQLVQMGRLARFNDGQEDGMSSTRALTSLYYNSTDARFRDLPTLQNVLRVFPWDKRSTMKEMGSSAATEAATMNFRVYWARVVVHIRLGAYWEALLNLTQAQGHLYQIPIADKGCSRNIWVCITSPWDESGALHSISAEAVLRDARIFLRAMLGDHAGALLRVNVKVEKLSENYEHLAERGVVKRLSGDLQGAFEDLNSAFAQAALCQQAALWDGTMYNILKHRGCVRQLMNDDVGAKEDAEHAQQLKLQCTSESEFYSCSTENLWKLLELPVNYLGFAL